MMKNKRHEKIAAEFVKLAQKRLSGKILFIILYGSVAKRNVSEDSDVDMFAVVKDFRSKGKLLDLAFELEFKYGVLLSMVVRTENEIKRMKSVTNIYLKEIKSTGKVLYGRAAI